MTEALWETILQTNLLGVFRCSKAAAPALREVSRCRAGVTWSRRGNYVGVTRTAPDVAH